jgi:hypothetical protein
MCLEPGDPDVERLRMLMDEVTFGRYGRFLAASGRLPPPPHQLNALCRWRRALPAPSGTGTLDAPKFPLTGQHQAIARQMSRCNFRQERSRRYSRHPDRCRDWPNHLARLGACCFPSASAQAADSAAASALPLPRPGPSPGAAEPVAVAAGPVAAASGRASAEASQSAAACGHVLRYVRTVLGGGLSCTSARILGGAHTAGRRPR